MFRGTTPTITFNLNKDISSAEKIIVTFSQNNKEVFTLSKSELEVEEGSLVCQLSQRQTLMFDHSAKLEMQIRVVIDGEAFASNTMETTVKRILKGGVL